MNLPQEIIGEILSYLPSDDRKSLRSFSSYSLVSKSWLDPSRRTLFAKFSIRSSTYDRFLNTISPTKTELLRYVRSLSYFGSGNEYRQQHRPISVLRDYFPSLRQLRALAFRQMQIEPTIPGCLDLFSAFQHTLSSLSLSYVSITWSGFASLVGYFPNLKDLLIYHPLIQMDDQPVPHPSRALRGKLSLLLDLVRSHNVDVLADHFPRLKPEYEEVLIGGTVEDQCRYLPIFQKVLKHLTIQQYVFTPLRCSPSYHEHCVATTGRPVTHRKLWTSHSAQNFKKYISGRYIHTSRMCPPSLLLLP